MNSIKFTRTAAGVYYHEPSCPHCGRHSFVEIPCPSHLLSPSPSEFSQQIQRLFLGEFKVAERLLSSAEAALWSVGNYEPI